MITCKFCGSQLPEHASFCGSCGQTLDDDTDSPTSEIDLSQGTVATPEPQRASRTPASNAATMQSNAAAGTATMLRDSHPDTPTALSTPSSDYLTPMSASHAEAAQPQSNYETVLDLTTAKEDEEEEKRRHAALLGPTVPLLGDAFGDGQQTVRNAPMVQGTPQFADMPTIQSTPQPGSEPAIPLQPVSYPGASFAQETAVQGDLLSTFPLTPLPQTPPLPVNLGPYTSPTLKARRKVNLPPGFTTWVSLFIVSVILIASVSSVSSIILSPSLSLNGNQTVTQGTSFTLNGNGFFPGSSVTLTRDGTIPLYYNQPTSSSAQPTSSRNNNIVNVGATGSFRITVAAGQDWQIGPHIIRASEGFLSRSAALSFQVLLPGQAPITITTTATATDTPPTPTPDTPTNFTAVSPANFILGPVGEGSNQNATTQVTLFTQGSNLMTWTATSSASWLQLPRASGQIQAPNSQQVTVSAISNGLKGGNYTATVTFSSDQTGKTATLNVTFIVRPGCIKGAPASLNFIGIAGTIDPKPQAVALTNCALAGAWAVTPSTNSSGNWLSVTPANSPLGGGATQTVSVQASNMNAQLGVGTYQGSLLFTDGSSQFTVSVTLTVGPPPMVSVSQPTINANASCQFTQTTAAGAGTWTCGEALTNSSAQFPLSWSASKGGGGIAVRPSRGVIPPGQTANVTILVSSNACGGALTITFKGPGNSAAVGVTCVAPAPPPPAPAPSPAPIGSTGGPPAASSIMQQDSSWADNVSRIRIQRR